MVLLTAEKISKSYTQRKLLDEVSFSIESGEKIGLVGVNGTGKTTLLRILAGQESADGGSFFKASGLRIGLLQQTPVLCSENTILQQVLQGVTAKEYECKSILNRLGLTEHDMRVGLLSGGQKKRVALAAALVHPVDLLILDEPTNHIDSAMVTWLEQYLQHYTGAVLMVTHDRYFLDRVTRRIFELDKSKLYSYDCNYTQFLQRKAQREEMAVANERKRQSLIRKEVEWILQGPCGRGTKSQYRIDRLQQLQAQNIDLSKNAVELSSMSSRLGRKIMEIEHISKGFDGKNLIEDFSYLLLRDDRIGIIGPNGVGKSTLLKMLMGQLTPDSGTISVGETVRIGYFAQECEDMDAAMRPIDYVKQEANVIVTPSGTLSATQFLEQFLFDAELQYTTIGRLSGGERRRLYLLKILMKAPNVLILDEPTNDLDIETLTILEDYLSSFAGAVILVSHDRYFLDKTAAHIFSFENAGVKSYLGGYTDWLIQQEDAEQAQPRQEKEKTVQKRTRTETLKFSFKEQREFATIDEDIAALETALEQAKAQQEASASDFVRLQETTQQVQALEQQLADKMSRWVYLNDLAEKISQQN